MFIRLLMYTYMFYIHTFTCICVYTGEMIAIMGPSGAGKSSILDILSMRTKRGKVTGNITVAGTPRNDSFKREIGYIYVHNCVKFLYIYTYVCVHIIRILAWLRSLKEQVICEILYVNSLWYINIHTYIHR